MVYHIFYIKLAYSGPKFFSKFFLWCMTSSEDGNWISDKSYFKKQILHCSSIRSVMVSTQDSESSYPRSSPGRGENYFHLYFRCFFFCNQPKLNFLLDQSLRILYGMARHTDITRNRPLVQPQAISYNVDNIVNWMKTHWKVL